MNVWPVGWSASVIVTEWPPLIVPIETSGENPSAPVAPVSPVSPLGIPNAKFTTPPTSDLFTVGVEPSGNCVALAVIFSIFCCAASAPNLAVFASLALFEAFVAELALCSE